MELGAVVLAHGGGKTASCDGGRAAGGPAFGHLNDGHARVGAFEGGHGAGCTAADDENVGLVVNDRNLRCDLPLIGLVILASIPWRFPRMRSTQASAKLTSLMCSGNSSTWMASLEIGLESV